MAQQATHLPWECLSTLYLKKILMVSFPFIRAIFISKSSPSWLLLSSPGLLSNLCGMWILTTSDSGTCMAWSVSHMLCGLWHTPATFQHLKNILWTYWTDIWMTLVMVSYNLIFLGLLSDKWELHDVGLGSGVEGLLSKHPLELDYSYWWFLTPLFHNNHLDKLLLHEVLGII